MLGATPEAHEVLYASQNHIGNSFNGKARHRTLYICPMQVYVRLGFMYGALLPAPAHFLEGDGERLRLSKIPTPEGARLPVIEQLVRAA